MKSHVILGSVGALFLCSALYAVTGGRAISIQGTFLQSGSGATLRTIESKERDIVSVCDFEAPCPSGTDDTAAFTAALAAGSIVYVPAGSFIVSSITFGGSTDPNTSATLLGKKLIGAGVAATTIKAKAGTAATNLITIGNSNYAVDGKWYIRNELSGMTIDPENLTNTTSNAAISMIGTFDNVIKDVKIGVLDVPRSRWDISMGRGVYTTALYNVNGKQLQMASDTTDRVTTIAVVGGSWTFVNISKALSISFLNTSIQGTTAAGYPTNRVQIDQSFNISFVDGDIEGSGTAFNVANTTGLHVIHNNVGMTGTQFFTLLTCSKVFARDNVFMNWSPTAAQYFSDGGGNTKLSLYDLSGAYFVGASYSKSGTQSFSASTFTVVNFDTSDYDADSAVTTGASWKYTVASAGIFHVKSQLQINAANGDITYAAVFKNGVEYRRSGLIAGTVVSGVVDLNIDVDVKCAAADTLDVRVFSNNATPVVQAASTQNYVNVVRHYGSGP